MLHAPYRIELMTRQDAAKVFAALFPARQVEVQSLSGQTNQPLESFRTKFAFAKRKLPSG
jgi:hypothetical protein